MLQGMGSSGTDLVTAWGACMGAHAIDTKHINLQSSAKISKIHANAANIRDSQPTCLPLQAAGRPPALRLLWEGAQAKESGLSRCPSVGTEAVLRCHC